MTQVIALFNHKGGVSKTTTTFHLGWKLASLGKKVLIVDADPQCNLTGLALGIDDYEGLFAFYDSKKNTDIFNSLAPDFSISSHLSSAQNTVPMAGTEHPNMSILAGNIRFSEIDIQLATAFTSSDTIPVLRQFIGSINHFIRMVAQDNAFDLVLIDMAPSVSATNHCILMGSDYFIIPTSPDFYCYQAIHSLKNVLPRWGEQIAKFRDGTDRYLLPKNNPKMLGFISQNYRVYTKSSENDGSEKKMSSAYKEWLIRIKQAVNDKLVPSLENANMLIDKKIFEDACEYDAPYHLAGIRDFNTLIPISQKLSKPIYEIAKQDGGWSGAAWERKENGKDYGVKMNIVEANIIYTNLAISILKMIGEYSPLADKAVFDNALKHASKPVQE